MLALRLPIAFFHRTRIMYKLSDYLIFTPAVANKQSDDALHIMYATRSGNSLLLKKSVCDNLKKGAFDKLGDETLAKLIQIDAIVPQEENEFETVLEENLAIIAGYRRLTIVIQPTANCQLGCNYCGQKHSKVNASQEISNKIVARIKEKLSTGAFKSLKLQWYGGEPLMAYSEILRISQEVREYCAEHNIKYGSHMITNGLSFKPAVFLNLLQQQVSHFQITLDGGQETHDVMRITKEGKKTFNIILDNVIDVTNLPEYIASDVSIAIRININQTTVRGIYKLIDLLAQHRLYEKKVFLDFACVVDWGDNDASKGSLSREEYAKQEIDWYMYANEKGFRFGGMIPERNYAPCMVVDPNAEVYDAFGNIYPCYEFPYTPKYEGADYKLGHLDANPPIQNPNAITRNWNSDVKTDISPCKKCPLFPVCGGGCPKQWYSGSIACPSFKLNITDRLALDYLNKREAAKKASAKVETLAPEIA
ncbi:radical SAM protein [Massilia sp. W12]|uniref:radical SAM/SPASM domain-containing protein n=1 Tax=Massilia sp. W12 TaxID=3126507 RepID=UPI0030D41B18